jgi:hypothetical protein
VLWVLVRSGFTTIMLDVGGPISAASQIVIRVPLAGAGSVTAAVEALSPSAEIQTALAMRTRRSRSR